MASLLDDKMRAFGLPKSGGADRKSQVKKLAIAVALLLVAGVVFAWSQGWLFGAKEERPAPPTAEQQAAFEQAKAKTDAAVKTGKSAVVGGD